MVPVGMIDDPSRLGAYYYIINVYERRSTRTPNATLDRQPKAVPKSAFTLRNQKKVDFTKKKITLSPVGNGICEPILLWPHFYCHQNSIFISRLPRYFVLRSFPPNWLFISEPDVISTIQTINVYQHPNPRHSISIPLCPSKRKSRFLIS